jgi:hypothetical protein
LKNRVFFGKTGPRREGRFPIPRKARKTPLCILGKKSPYREKHRENDAFREVLAATRQAEKAKNGNAGRSVFGKLFHWRESEIRETPNLWGVLDEKPKLGKIKICGTKICPGNLRNSL